jgi:hypothetical protein
MYWSKFNFHQCTIQKDSGKLAPIEKMIYVQSKLHDGHTCILDTKIYTTETLMPVCYIEFVGKPPCIFTSRYRN